MENFRVYDCKNHAWVNDKVFLSSDGELYIAKKICKNTIKVCKLNSEDYVCHHNTQAIDANGNEIFEGDICRLSGVDSIYIILYYGRNASFYAMNLDNDGYREIDFETSMNMHIIGNVFDTPEYILNK